MFGKRRKAALDDEISVARFVVSVVILVAGALVMGSLPFLKAITRIGNVGTALFLLGIVILAIAFFLAYERVKPSSPPTPRRDFAVILFSALLIGLWASAFTNEVIAVLVLGACGAIVLRPEDRLRG